MPGERHALLIATGTYDNPTLRALRSPEQDVTALAAVLRDPGIGDFDAEILVDKPSHRLTRALESFFLGRGSDDTLLLHLSCHGIKDDDGQLYFAASDTDKDLPASTTVPAAFLRGQMERCRARSIVVLLDCCYSGAFMSSAKGDSVLHLKDELAGHGRVVLTATNRTEYAWEGEQVTARAPQLSYFTDALVEGLRSGAADLGGDGLITVNELYEYVYESVRRRGARQTPHMWADLQYQVVIARTPAAADSPVLVSPARRARVRRGRDALIRLDVTLEEAVFGAVKDIQVNTAIRCEECLGKGARPGTPEVLCDSCGGRGGESAEKLCPHCEGCGTAFLDPCPRCRGAARVSGRRTLTLKVPAGVFNGARIQLRGEGESGPGGGPQGDLYVEITELPHGELGRHGDADLHRYESVYLSVLKKGGTIEVATLDGPRTLRISRGLKSGTVLRLQGLGATRLEGGGRGDLLVTVLGRS
ncbi:DnaJ C-terminal domain-containing protein [Streptomyces sp. NPDC056308]|uniref:caspase, EACC1-associated type n=1 Tax=Streptomyces sp. NPDC056308 TaxID=3345780 RepID=UPI0035DAC056